MAKKNSKRRPKAGRFQTPTSLEVLVVSPNGHIKTLYYGRNVCPWQLLIRKVDGHLSITITEEAKADKNSQGEVVGWVFLEELYRREGRVAAWEKYHDYWVRAAHKHERLEPPPDSALPMEVLRRREALTKPVPFDWSEEDKPKKAAKKVRHDNVSSPQYALCE